MIIRKKAKRKRETCPHEKAKSRANAGYPLVHSERLSGEGGGRTFLPPAPGGPVMVSLLQQRKKTSVCWSNEGCEFSCRDIHRCWKPSFMRTGFGGKSSRLVGIVCIPSCSSRPGSKVQIRSKPYRLWGEHGKTDLRSRRMNTPHYQFGGCLGRIPDGFYTH